MKSRFSRRQIVALVVVGAVALYAAYSSFWRNTYMSPLSPRLQTLLETVEPQCFGRFLIDLPVGTHTAWGKTLGFKVDPGHVGELGALVESMENERKKEPRHPKSKSLSLYLETRSGALPGTKHVISQNDFDSDNYLRINTYHALGDNLVTSQFYSRAQELSDTLAEIDDDLRRMRPRAEHEIPTDPGMCIAHAFLADRPTADKEPVADFLQVGFRLKDPPDVHLSIDIQAANDEWAKPGLEKKLADTERTKPGVYDFLHRLRRGHREVPAWKDGYEMLTRSPGDARSKSHHDFWMIFTGAKNTLLRPYVDIRLQTGVSDNEAGGVLPSLSDDDTVALWDRLTSTIRVRPTSVAKAESAPEPEVPLGTLAATGRACPRSGLWQCAAESSPVQGGNRRWFRAGETLPQALLLADPSVWQRLRGEAPSHATNTVWKLVGLEPPVAR